MVCVVDYDPELYPGCHLKSGWGKVDDKCDDAINAKLTEKDHAKREADYQASLVHCGMSMGWGETK